MYVEDWGRRVWDSHIVKGTIPFYILKKGCVRPVFGPLFSVPFIVSDVFPPPSLTSSPCLFEPPYPLAPSDLDPYTFTSYSVKHSSGVEYHVL